MEKKFEELKRRLMEIDDLNSSAAVLSWDQATYMPPGGAAARGRQMATLSSLAQEKFIDLEIGKLLDDLQGYEDGLDYNSNEASLIRKARRDYEKAVKVPAAWVAKFETHAAASYQDWAAARPENDFKRLEDNLKKTLEMSVEFADFFPGYEHIADPLIDNSDEGMKASDIQRVFSELQEELVPLVQAITEQEAVDDNPVKQAYTEDDQLAFGQIVIQDFGYDFERGRQDKTYHPFMTKFSLGDVRITTRVNENDLSEALFSTLHEAGHGMYEQGINPVLEGTPLADGSSSGVHESQSRTWENVVGRSRGFWEHYYPKLQQAFPEQLAQVELEAFYRAINKVSRSLIRTDADEVTYNLHVMIRFDLELQMLEGKLNIEDLPEAWHARYESDLGLRAPSDVDGVLQDVHWYAGTIGGSFQGYTLGNILGALFYESALKANPDIPDEIRHGQFDTLHSWLKENLYMHGAKFTADELIQRVTGGPLRIEPYIAYLKGKYGEIYRL
ncbi:MAG: carboxypeptidase M32 [Chloroflexi bacterium]|nr:carboxypeptidase M32 [Chloroflexota bacterium]MQC26840.1 carboxypeptidase M32 [Chloroflexota bacterium]